MQVRLPQLRHVVLHPEQEPAGLPRERLQEGARDPLRAVAGDDPGLEIPRGPRVVQCPLHALEGILAPPQPHIRGRAVQEFLAAVSRHRAERGVRVHDHAVHEPGKYDRHGAHLEDRAEPGRGGGGGLLELVQVAGDPAPRIRLRPVASRGTHIWNCSSRRKTRPAPAGAPARAGGSGRAGDGIRTHDFNLGKVALYH